MNDAITIDRYLAEGTERIEINPNLEHLANAMRSGANGCDAATQALFRINEDLFKHEIDAEEIMVLLDRAEDIAIQAELAAMETEALAGALGAAIGAALAPILGATK